MKGRSRIVALLLLAGTLACGSGGPPRVAATVEGVPVPSARVERLTDLWMRSERRQSLAQAQGGEISRDDSARQVLAFVIRSTFLTHLATQMKVEDRPGAFEALAPQEIPSAEFSSLGWSKDDLAEALRDARLSRAIAERVFPTVAVSEVELEERYDRSANLFNQSWRADVRVAYFDSPEPARALRERGVTGDAFDTAARQGGAIEAGSLGSLSPAAPLPAPVLQAVAALAAGQVSDPLPSGGGFLVLAVDHREDRTAVSFEEARADLGRLVEDQKRQSLFLDWFAKRLGQARVKVAGHYGRWDAKTQLVG